MTPTMRAAAHAVDVLARIRRRLEAAGAVRELEHLNGLSVDELDLIVLAELRDPLGAPRKQVAA